MTKLPDSVVIDKKRIIWIQKQNEGFWEMYIFFTAFVLQKLF